MCRRRSNLRTQAPTRALTCAIVGAALCLVLSHAADAALRHPAARHLAARHPAVVEKAVPSPWRQPLTDDERIDQVLNRLSFGPRPGDVDRVRQMGLNRYIDEQLHPETIPDTTVDQELSGLATLTLQPEVLSELYSYYGPRPPIPPAAKTTSSVDPKAFEEVLKQAEKDPAYQAALHDPERIHKQTQKYLIVPELQYAKVIRAVDSNRQLLEVMTDFWTNHFNIDVRKDYCGTLKIADDREVIRPHALGKFRDLLEASAKSPAMLWYLDNAQSYSIAPVTRRGKDGKVIVVRQATDRINENYGRELMELHTLGVDGGYTQKDVQEVARCFTGWGIDRKTGEFHFDPRRHDAGEKVVLGHTIPAGGGIQDGETVLDILASDHHTARHIARELCQRFVADDPPASVVGLAARTFKETGGDIAAVVRAIVASPEFASRAAYRAKIKSPFEYAVSCVRALDGHIRPVTEVPASTANGAANLVVTLPEPPPSNLHTAALHTGRREKVERTRTVLYSGLPAQIGRMGEPLFQYQPPTGYPEDSSEWLGAGALLSRMNFALALARGAYPDVEFAPLEERSYRSPLALMNDLERDGLQDEMAPATRRMLLQQASDTTPKTADLPLVAALVLGSPEFQRR